jgi:hypothetical protein
MVSSLNLSFSVTADGASPGRSLSFAYLPGAASDMFFFDGFWFEYLIGSASAEGTTELSKPDVNLLTRTTRPRGKFPCANRAVFLLCKPERLEKSM